MTSTSAATASMTTSIAPRTTSSVPTAIFVTPALTTTFTPPPSCTQQHLTMLESDAYRIWLNEPYPVPNTTISDCYPQEFMTSYLEERASTVVPAFSPLVCPDNYHTVFSQPMSDRPLYIACCPSSYTLVPPATSTPGRPAYGGTCYTNIMTVQVTQYDNSSSSGVTLFAPTATTNQAYAHPIDGFAMDAVTAASQTSTSVVHPSATGFQSPNTATQVSPAAIAGLVVGIVVLGAILSTIAFLLRRNRRRRAAREMQQQHPGWHQFKRDPSAVRYGYPQDKYARPGSHGKPSEMGTDWSWVSEMPQKNPPPPPPPQELDANQSVRGSKSPTVETMSARQKRASSSLTGHWPAAPGGPKSMDITPPSSRRMRSIRTKRTSVIRHGSRSSQASTASLGVALFSPTSEDGAGRWDTGSPISPSSSMKRSTG